jgi:hypothetical protein
MATTTRVSAAGFAKPSEFRGVDGLPELVMLWALDPDESLSGASA